MSAFFRRTKSLIGLDIGSSAVKAIELQQSASGYKVAAIGREPVPPGSIVDGAIVDGGAVADVIRDLLQKNNFKAKEVVGSLSGNAVIVKKIVLPQMTEEELDEAIYWEAEQYIPFDIQDVNLDYQMLEAGSGEADRDTMDVLLVAAKKEKIADYTGVISQAGRVPVVVDVDAFALQNAYEVNYGIDMARVVVLVNAGASAININIIEGGRSLFTRDISLGGDAYTEALQNELGLSFEHADLVKRGVPVEDARTEDVDPIVQTVTETLLLEVEKTFDFFKATAASDRIDALVVSGGAAGVDGFTEAFEARFALPVTAFDPFRQIAFDTTKFSEELRAELTPTIAVAVGLAVRRVDER